MILYLSYDGLTDQVGTSQILPYLEGLAENGVEVHILSFEKGQEFKQYGTQIAERVKDSGLAWTALQYTKQPPVLSTVMDIMKMKSMVKKLAKRKQFTHVFSRSYIPMLAAMPLQKNGMKVVFDMRGFWADERRDGNLWKKGNALFDSMYNFFKNKEILWFEKADKIVSLTNAAIPHMQKLVAEKHSIKEKTSVIPCCVDMEKFNPNRFDLFSARKNLRNRFGWDENNHILVYLGALGTWYEADKMMESFSILKEQNPHLKMLWITREPAEIINKEASTYNVSEEEFAITSAASEEVPELLAGCDFGIFYITPAYSKQASSPIKQGEYWAMGLPVIANSGIGDSDYIINRYNSGISISSPTDLKNLNLKTIQLPASYRKDCAEYFGLKNGISKYARILNS